MTYRLPDGRRVLCCLLIICYLLCAICMPYAQAVATELVAAGTLTVIAAIWMASGAELPSGADIYKAAKQVYDQYIAKDPALRAEAHALGQAYVVRNGTTMGASVLKCSQRLWQAICGRPAAEMITDGYMGTYRSVDFTDKLSVQPFSDLDLDTQFIHFFKFRGHTYTLTWSQCDDFPADNDWLQYNVFRDNVFLKSVPRKFGYFEDVDAWSFNFSGLADWFNILITVRVNGTVREQSLYGYVNDDGKMGYFQQFGYPQTVGFPESVMIPVGGTIAQPADDIVVKMPADIPTQQEDGTIVYPDLPTSAADYQYPVADIPLQEGATSVPEDVIIDAATGEAVGDVTIPDNPDIPVNPDVSVDWPAPGTVTLPELIVSKFPFCIPFDIVRLVDTLCADPIAPSWTIHLDIGGKIGGDIELDLERFDSVIKICRWGLIAITVAGLAYATSRYIKW